MTLRTILPNLLPAILTLYYTAACHPAVVAAAVLMIAAAAVHLCGFTHQKIKVGPK